MACVTYWFTGPELIAFGLFESGLMMFRLIQSELPHYSCRRGGLAPMPVAASCGQLRPVATGCGMAKPPGHLLKVNRTRGKQFLVCYYLISTVENRQSLNSLFMERVSS